MREVADRDRIHRLREEFGRAARGDVRVYLVGGATAVLVGWRPTTIDVDFVMCPEDETLLRAIPSIREIFVAQHGRAGFFHFDMYAQALAKVERGIEPDLYRFPAINPPSFRRGVEETFGVGRNPG